MARDDCSGRGEIGGGAVFAGRLEVHEGAAGGRRWPEEGGQNWVRLPSLIGTCKMNGVKPYACIRTTLESSAAGNPQSRLDDLLPWNFRHDNDPT